MNEATRWEEVTSLSSLHVFPATSGVISKIYANGKHQAVVDVTLSPTVIGKAVSLSRDELLKHIELVDYATDKPLGTFPTSGWSFSSVDNHLPKIDILGECIESELPDEANKIRLYVTCTREAEAHSVDVAVAVKLANGQRFSTARGGEQGDHTRVRIVSQPPIDFSDPALWSMSKTKFNDGVGDINSPYYVVYEGGAGWQDEYIGSSAWQKITFQLSMPYPGNSVHIELLDKSFPSIDQGRENPPFEFVGEACAYNGLTCDGAYNLLIWFISPPVSNDVGIRAGQRMFLPSAGWASSRYLIIGKNDSRNKKNVERPRDMTFDVYLWKITIPRGPLQHKWAEQLGVRRVRVSDAYGNESILKLSFESTRFEPYPTN